MLPAALLLYLAVINVVAELVFLYDKRAAIMKDGRVPERVLHILELAGGVFLAFPLLFVFRHKNRKRRYWLTSLAILAAWVAALWLLR